MIINNKWNEHAKEKYLKEFLVVIAFATSYFGNVMLEHYKE